MFRVIFRLPMAVNILMLKVRAIINFDFILRTQDLLKISLLNSIFLIIILKKLRKVTDARIGRNGRGITNKNIIIFRLSKKVSDEYFSCANPAPALTPTSDSGDMEA